MAATKRIKRALVSVFHKEGLDEILKSFIARALASFQQGGHKHLSNH